MISSTATSKTILLFIGIVYHQIHGFSLTSRQFPQKATGRSLTKTSSAATYSSNEAPPLKRHKPRKICLLIEPTPFTHVSGYANRFQEMLKYLKKAGDKVEVVTADGSTDEKDLPKNFLGYPIHHTQGFSFPLYNQITLTIDLPELMGLKVIDKLKPDLIHVTSPGFFVFAGLFYSRIMRIPLVISYHTHLPLYGRNYLGFIPGIEEMSWKALRMVHSRADLTLVTSPQIQEEMTEHGIPRVQVWRKGIDTERFHPKFRDEKMRDIMTQNNPDDFLMVYIGRLGTEKRLKDLRAVLKAMPNARLCIVGKGPQDTELHDYFKGTNTHFTGQLLGDDLSKAFASADAFVMPSDSETLGFVVLESMASGVPVVAVRAGGIPSIISHEETSILVETGNTDEFIHYLKKLQSDKKYCQELGQRARSEAERWGWEAATSVLRNVQYQRAIVNFHSRAFGGFGRPGTKGLWRLLRWRIRRVMSKFGLNGASGLLDN